MCYCYSFIILDWYFVYSPNPDFWEDIEIFICTKNHLFRLYKHARMHSYVLHFFIISVGFRGLHLHPVNGLREADCFYIGNTAEF